MNEVVLTDDANGTAIRVTDETFSLRLQPIRLDERAPWSVTFSVPKATAPAALSAAIKALVEDEDVLAELVEQYLRSTSKRRR